MKKVIIIAVLALNAVCLSYLAFSESSQAFNINSAIAEESEWFYDVSDYNGEESVSIENIDPDCGKCITTSHTEWSGRDCSGIGSVFCVPYYEYSFCYEVDCMGGPNCIDPTYSNCEGD